MLGKVLTVLALLFGIGLLGALELAATHHTWQARQARRGLPNSSGVATSALSRKGNPDSRGALQRSGLHARCGENRALRGPAAERLGAGRPTPGTPVTP